MNITKAIAEQVATKMVKPIAERISNEHDILNDIVNTLLSLRNSKKVKEAFPEAYEYIKGYEDKTTTEVVLPVETIMNTINKYRKE